MTSEEYGNLLILIRHEIETAAAAFYTAKAINDLALADGAIYSKLDRDADFWNLQVHGLQTAYFMGLGKLFDKRGDAHSVMDLLHATKEHPGFFSKDALRTRKLRTVSDQHRKQVIETSLQGVWEPKRAELRQLCKEVEPSIHCYNKYYQTIRHGLFGHMGKDQEKIANVLSTALLSDIDTMFQNLLEIMSALYALFDNGARHERGIGPHKFARDVHDRTLRVLDRL